MHRVNDSTIVKSPSATVQLVLAGVAALLLLWGLGSTYLWQDEAATAVLAQRMLRFGRPLAYDGVNLITIDHFAAEDVTSLDQRTADPQAAVRYYINRGDFKKDSTWKWQPWGQFVVAAASLKMLGANTIAARLPFALAGILTLLILYRICFIYLQDSRIALLAAIFLISNAYWILHTRQCRYYSLSSLFLMLTLASYMHWQAGGRGGVPLFVLSAWGWFQVDYGTVWPVLAILFVDALIAQRRSWWRPLLVGIVLSAAIAPFAFYYEIWGRVSVPVEPWVQRFERNLFNINEYVGPMLIVAAAILIWSRRRNTLLSVERRLVGICCAILIAMVLWVPTVAPAAFLRYSIIVAPLGCLLTAWVLVQLGKITSSSLNPALPWIGAAIFVLTPWLSLPLHALRPRTLLHATVLRPELNLLRERVFGHPLDPNRPVIEWLRQNAAPDDEILINYEDVPLMFYLPNPIRGGIAAFRVEDDSRKPPEFLVLRRSVTFVHWPVFEREMQRYAWAPIPVEAPDIVCGVCPDPVERSHPAHPLPIYVARRVGASDTSRQKPSEEAISPGH